MSFCSTHRGMPTLGTHIEGKAEQPYEAVLESGLEYRLPAMAMPSDGNQTSDQAALPMQQRIKRTSFVRTDYLDADRMP